MGHRWKSDEHRWDFGFGISESRSENLSVCICILIRGLPSAVLIFGLDVRKYTVVWDSDGHDRG